MGRLPDGLRSEEARLRSAELEIDKIVEKSALQRHQSKLDNYLLDLTREQRERMERRYRQP